jgi:intracellular multiplication protein IcmP
MAKQGGGEKGDMETNMLFMGIAGIMVAVGTWIALGPGFSSFMGILRRYELVPFSYFFEHADQLRMKLAYLNGGSLDFANTLAMLRSSGNYVRWLYILPFPFLAFLLLGGSPRGRFQRQHSMASLTKQESKVWPEISPVVGKQGVLMDGDERAGEWAVAMTEWEFAEKYKLAKRGENKVDREAARAVFVKQLGPRWSGPNALPPHRKALFAAFLLRIVGESDEAIARLRTMAKSFAAGGLAGMDTAFADAVIAKYGKHPNLQRAIAQHAYTFTVMATMLQLSRADGVLASPMFIWLKTVDRGLWYMLNNVGRYAFHVECAGVASHWLFEKTVGQSCATPMVEKAIDGLAMGLKEYTEDDALDRLYK